MSGIRGSMSNRLNQGRPCGATNSCTFQCSCFAGESRCIWLCSMGTYKSTNGSSGDTANTCADGSPAIFYFLFKTFGLVCQTVR